MLWILALIVLLSLGMGSAHAQDPHFTQYLSVPTYLNPAFAGYDGCSRFMASYRNQWPATFASNYQTVHASYDQYVRPMRGGVGVNFHYDREGEGRLQGYAASALYAPVLRLFNSQVVVSPAVELGWKRRRMDWSRMTFGTLIDPRYGFNYQPGLSVEVPPDHKDFFDASAGLLLTHHGLVYGVAFHHITQPEDGLAGHSRLPLKSTAHVAYQGDVSPKFAVSPSFIYMNQQDFHTFLHSLTFQFHGARLGTGVRHGASNFDSVLFMAGYGHKRFSVGYSFDLTVSSLGMDTGGSHELSLAVRFNCRNKEQWSKGPRMVGF